MSKQIKLLIIGIAAACALVFTLASCGKDDKVTAKSRVSGDRYAKIADELCDCVNMECAQRVKSKYKDQGLFDVTGLSDADKRKMSKASELIKACVTAIRASGAP